MYPNLLILKKKKQKNIRCISEKIDENFQKSYMKNYNLDVKLPVI